MKLSVRIACLVFMAPISGSVCGLSRTQKLENRCSESVTSHNVVKIFCTTLLSEFSM